MGLFNWLFGASGGHRQPQNDERAIEAASNEYVETERRLLLWAAEQIKAARDPLDEMMAASAGLGSVVSTLRRRYGYGAVEANCPAERMIAGFAGQGASGDAGRILDELVSGLRAAHGDTDRTWRIMAMMVNPTNLSLARQDAERSDSRSPEKSLSIGTFDKLVAAANAPLSDKFKDNKLTLSKGVIDCSDPRNAASIVQSIEKLWNELGCDPMNWLDRHEEILERVASPGVSIHDEAAVRVVQALFTTDIMCRTALKESGNEALASAAFKSLTGTLAAIEGVSFDRSRPDNESRAIELLQEFKGAAAFFDRQMARALGAG